MSEEIWYGSETRNALLAGANKLADTVRVTLGPCGRDVAVPQKANVYGADYGDSLATNTPVLVTNDGATIAKSVSLSDPVENMGAQLLKEAAAAANDAAGDGTTTAIVLAQALLKEAVRLVAAGADPLALRRGIATARDEMLQHLKTSAVKATSLDDISHAASVSCQDDELGALVGEALHRVGAEGVVNVDDSKRYETTLDVQEGIVFDRGLLSPHLATDKNSGSAKLENPYILLTDKKLTSKNDVLPALICAAEDGRDCLFVCDGVEGEALALLVANKSQGDMGVGCVLAPGYGEGRNWRMDDLAIQTGGWYLSEQMGLRPADATRELLGSARSATVTRTRTSIAGGAPCDGSEMVDMDTFGVMPKPASHAKTYAELLPFLCEAYADWVDDVRDGDYPEEKHGYHMDPEELKKFNEMMDKF